MDVRPQVQDVDEDGDSNVDKVEDNEDVVIHSLEEKEAGPTRRYKASPLEQSQCIADD